MSFFTSSTYSIKCVLQSCTTVKLIVVYTTQETGTKYDHENGRENVDQLTIEQKLRVKSVTEEVLRENLRRRPHY